MTTISITVPDWALWMLVFLCVVESVRLILSAFILHFTRMLERVSAAHAAAEIGGRTP